MFLAKLNEALSSKNSWKSFVSDRLSFFSLSIALLINIIQWVIIYINIRPSGKNILLHYNIIYGDPLVDKDIYAFLVPGIALIFLAINFVTAYFIFQREKLASYFLNMANIPVQLVFLIATVVLIMSNN